MQGKYVRSGLYAEKQTLSTVPKLKKSNKIQKYADISLLLSYSTCLGRPSRPSSGVHKTVVVASGTDHTIWEERPNKD